VETLVRRLAIAKQVALAKWDSQASVEDAAREARVIALLFVFIVSDQARWLTGQTIQAGGGVVM